MTESPPAEPTPAEPTPTEPSSEVGRLSADLELLRHRFDAVAAGIANGLIVCDPTGRVVVANGRAQQMLNLGDDVIGRPLLELIRTPAMTELSRREAGGEAEFELPGPPRRHIVAVAHPDSEGGRVITVRDVTVVRRLESMRRDFVSNVSHELRTPISVIRVNAETLLDGGLEQRAHAERFCEAILRHAERLSGLVEDLLDLSRIESGGQNIDLLPLDVADAVAAAVGTVAPRAASKAVGVSAQVPVGLTCVADMRALDQVLVNLIDNAIAHGDEGGAIEVRASLSGDLVRLEVQDDGPGIDPVHRGRVFERFYRVDPGRSRKRGGTGLGLAIVKHLVESMNGTVGVLGVRPRGSIFWVELPA